MWMHTIYAPSPNVNYIRVQAITNAIIILIYLINVLYNVPTKRVDKDFGPLINEIWDSGTKHTPISIWINSVDL